MTRGRQFTALLQLELRELFRSSAIRNVLLLPALLSLPLVTGAIGFYSTTFENPTVIAVRPGLPTDLDLESALRDVGFEVVVDENPRRLWEQHRADAAVVDWVTGDGIGDAEHPLSDEVWRLRLLVDDPDLAEQLDDLVENAGCEVLNSWVTATGGSPARDVTVVNLQSTPVPPTNTTLLRLPRYFLCWLWFLSCATCAYAVFQPYAHDRRRGWMEALAPLPIALSHWLIAKILAVTLVTTLAAALFSLNVLPWIPDFGPVALWALPRFFVGSFTMNSIGVLSALFSGPDTMTSPKTTTTLLALMALAGWGAFDSAPVWMPIAGLAVATGLQSVLPLLTTAGTAVVVWSVAHRLLERRSVALQGSGE